LVWFGDALFFLQWFGSVDMQVAGVERSFILFSAFLFFSCVFFVLVHVVLGGNLTAATIV
jgi:hypothetical protein